MAGRKKKIGVMLTFESSMEGWANAGRNLAKMQSWLLVSGIRPSEVKWEEDGVVMEVQVRSAASSGIIFREDEPERNTGGPAGEEVSPAVVKETQRMGTPQIQIANFVAIQNLVHSEPRSQVHVVNCGLDCGCGLEHPGEVGGLRPEPVGQAARAHLNEAHDPHPVDRVISSRSNRMDDLHRGDRITLSRLLWAAHSFNLAAKHGGG